ncbi:MAG: hypothetical protein C0467_15685 [Planctomycetaceae bacterium]|nr:hypothetical protein [Planctomycetaceae bacterium]
MDGILEWAVTALVLAAVVPITLWVAGALYFDACGGSRWGRAVTLAWVGCVAAAFVFWDPLWQPLVAFLGVTTAILAWWLRLKPRQDRDWETTVAVLPRATRTGDAITIENVRNFEYRTLTDFTPRYDTRTVHLANLRGADIILFNWGSPWMSHPVLVFDFGPDGRVCMSIEVRYRKGQGYSVLKSLYRQQELIFVVADERDAILRRTKYGKEQTAHLYRLAVAPDAVRNSFLDYIAVINGLCETPRWYHGLCANCTTSFYRLPHSRRLRDWRVLANGRFDRALYDNGQLDQSLPFDELRRLALINDIVNAAPEDGFGDHLRRELEKHRHER